MKQYRKAAEEALIEVIAGGLDPDENVYPVILSADEVEDGIRKGTIFDSKTLSVWVAYKLKR